jgi:hypothetical protein
MPSVKKTLRSKYPRRRPQDPRLTYQTRPKRSVAHTRLQRRLAAETDVVERRNLIRQAIKLLCDFKGRPGQIEHHLAFVAKTSFVQVLPLLVPQLVTLIFVPLLALGFEQE